MAAYFDEDPFAHSGFQQFVVASLNLSDRWESMLPDLAEHRVDLSFQRIYLTVCWQSLLGTLRNWALLILTHVGYPSPIAGIMNLGNNSWRQKKVDQKTPKTGIYFKVMPEYFQNGSPKFLFNLILILKFGLLNPLCSCFLYFSFTSSKNSLGNLLKATSWRCRA